MFSLASIDYLYTAKITSLLGESTVSPYLPLSEIVLKGEVEGITYSQGGTLAVLYNQPLWAGDNSNKEVTKVYLFESVS